MAHWKYAMHAVSRGYAAEMWKRRQMYIQMGRQLKLERLAAEAAEIGKAAASAAPAIVAAVKTSPSKRPHVLIAVAAGTAVGAVALWWLTRSSEKESSTT